MLLLYANGMQSTEIARVLFLSPHTVIAHRKWAMLKLGQDTITAAVSFAWRQCLIEADEIKGGPRERTGEEATEALLGYGERRRTRMSSSTSQITRSSTAFGGRSLPIAGRHGPAPRRSRSTPKAAT